MFLGPQCKLLELPVIVTAIKVSLLLLQKCIIIKSSVIVYAAVNCYWVLIHVKSVSFIHLALSAPSIRPYKGQTEVLEGSTKDIKCVTEGSPKPTVDWYRNGKKMNVTNCHSNPQSCDKVDYEVYEEGDGSSGLHTIHTVKVLKIRSALYPRDVGEFKCVASNGVSPDAKLIVSLDVQGI